MVAGVQGRPHIVFVLADDLGFNGVGFHNPALRTPTIDALAAGGLQLESYYTHHTCAPTRSSLLTGRWPFKVATTTNFGLFHLEEGTDLDYTMLPERLRTRGYYTALVVRAAVHMPCTM